MNSVNSPYLIVADGGKRLGIAYGSFKIFTISGALVVRKQFVLGNMSSNLSEYMSMFKALTWANEHELEDVRIITDSKLLVMHINGKSKCTDSSLCYYKTKIYKLLREFKSYRLNFADNRHIKSILGH